MEIWGNFRVLNVIPINGRIRHKCKNLVEHKFDMPCWPYNVHQLLWKSLMSKKRTFKTMLIMMSTSSWTNHKINQNPNPQTLRYFEIHAKKEFMYQCLEYMKHLKPIVSNGQECSNTLVKWLKKLNHHGLLGILESLRKSLKSLKYNTHNNNNLQQLECPKNIY